MRGSRIIMVLPLFPFAESERHRYAHMEKSIPFLYIFISFTHFHLSNRSDVVLVLFLMNIEISIAAIPKTR